jgi:F0F1-type ATP synthase membrane subunit b/b'
MKKIIYPLIASMLLLAGSAAFAEEPVRNVNPKRHPNIAAAQRLSQKAYERIVAAQQANEWDMNGHAQKAKELLDQVNHELKEAAEAANRHTERENR